jgi:hypothetical protein
VSGGRRSTPVVACLVALWLGAAAAESPPLRLVESIELHGHRVETWGAADGFPDALVRVVPPRGEAVEVRDAVVRLVSQASEWHPDAVTVVPGDDLTGDGVPDLLVESYSLGAHCCFGYLLLSLGETLEVVWSASTLDAAVLVVDLEHDGRRQLLLRDMSFAYAFCSFASSPAPPVVLSLGREGVVLANGAFARAYERELAGALEAALAEPTGPPDDARCAVAHLALVLLYAGHTDTAERALLRLDRGADATAFRDALWAIASASPWYLPPARAP